MRSTSSAATSAAVTALITRPEAGRRAARPNRFLYSAFGSARKKKVRQGGRRSVKQSFFRATREESSQRLRFSPRRPAGSENCTALPSSARLIAEARRVNIIHISRGWSADGRKLQGLSRGREEAERSPREAGESSWRRCRGRQRLSGTRRRANCRLIVTAGKAGVAFPLAPRHMISDKFTSGEWFPSLLHPKCLSLP